MSDDLSIYQRVTGIRAAAFELIDELSRSAERADADQTHTLALVRMQAVANGLGRIQMDLQTDSPGAVFACTQRDL